ncbi:MAG: EpsG family protein, partial [Alishewanella aestuarii]
MDVIITKKDLILGSIPYFIGWFLIYYAFVLYHKHRKRIFLFIPILYIALIVGLRNSGTDTYTYEDIIKKIYTQKFYNIEPAFSLISYFLMHLTDSSVISLRIIGLLFVSLLFIYVLRASRYENIYLFLYFLPVFGYQYGMNAVRAGLAFAFILLAYQELRRNNLITFNFLNFIAITFHIQSIFWSLMLILYSYNMDYKKRIFSIGISLLALLTVLASPYDLKGKIGLYREYASPTFKSKEDTSNTSESNQTKENIQESKIVIPSGVSKTTLALILYISFLLSPISMKARIYTIPLIALVSLFQLLSIKYYAALRFLDMIAILLPMILAMFYEKEKSNLPKIFLIGLII